MTGLGPLVAGFLVALGIEAGLKAAAEAIRLSGYREDK